MICYDRYRSKHMGMILDNLNRLGWIFQLVGFLILVFNAPLMVAQDIDDKNTEEEKIEDQTPEVERLKEVIIKGQKRVRSQISIKQDEFADHVQLNFSDVVQTLKSKPGVTFDGSSFSSAIYIQGGDDSEWIGLFEHVWVLRPIRWNNRVSMFNPKIIDTLDFYTAAYPASIGQGLSGVLWVKTIEPSDTIWQGSVSFGTETEAIIHGPLNKHLKMLIQLRRSWVDYFANNTLTQEGENKASFPFLLDGVFKLIWNPHRNHSWQFLSYGSYEGLTARNVALAALGDEEEEQKEINANDVSYEKTAFDYDEQNYIASLKYTYHLSAKNYLVSTASLVPLIGSYKTTGSSLTTLDVNIISLPYQFTMDVNVGSLENHEINFGFFSYHYNVHSEGKSGNNYIDTNGRWTNDNYAFDSQFQKNYYSVYALDDYHPFDFLTLQLGVRSAYYEIGNEWVVQPRGGVKIDFFNMVDLFYRSGYYTRNSIDRSRGGNLTLLKSEKSIHQIAGVEKRIKNFYFLSEFFYKDYWNLRVTDLNNSENSSGTRLVYGFDTHFAFNKTKSSLLYGHVTYTYTRAWEKVGERAKGEGFLIEPYPQLGASFVPGFLREHTVNTYVEFFPLRFFKNIKREIKELSLGLEFNYLSGKPYTKARDVEMYEIPNVGRRFRFVYDKYNQARTPGIYHVNVKLTTPPIIFYKRHKLTSYMTLHNLFSAANVVDVQYGVKSKYLEDREAKIDRAKVISLGEGALREIRVLDSALGLSFRGGFVYHF